MSPQQREGKHKKGGSPHSANRNIIDLGSAAAKDSPPGEGPKGRRPTRQAVAVGDWI